MTVLDSYTHFDFYSEEAKVRGETRKDAKMRLHLILFTDKPEDFEYEDFTEALLSVVHPDVAMAYLTHKVESK